MGQRLGRLIGLYLVCHVLFMCHMSHITYVVCHRLHFMVDKIAYSGFMELVIYGGGWKCSRMITTMEALDNIEEENKLQCQIFSIPHILFCNLWQFALVGKSHMMVQGYCESWGENGGLKCLYIMMLTLLQLCWPTFRWNASSLLDSLAIAV